jgi:hypothetical protein
MGYPNEEDHVERDKLKAAERKKAWAATKAAVGAYAKNPCKATEIEVAAALDKVKILTEATEPEDADPRTPTRAPKKPATS